MGQDDQRRAGVECPPEILQPRYVYRSYGQKFDAARGHNLGQPEGASDLHELAPTRRGRPAVAQRVKREQDRARVVVDDQRIFRPGQRAQRLRDQRVAPAAFAALQIHLEVTIAREYAPRALEEGRPERRPARTGV